MKRLHPSRRPARFWIAALVATAATLTASGDTRVREFERTALAMAKRVFLPANTENGPIRPGDPLTPAEAPGFVKRFVLTPGKSEGVIIGKALQSLDAGSGMILVQLGGH